MNKIFGTDGVRGIANKYITCEMAMNIGRAAAVLVGGGGKKPKILIGKDTRISSGMLEGALVSGVCSVGADAVLLGIVPTPAVAYLVRVYGADAGVIISASHNSYEFNGIKIFDKNGFKLADSVENEIEDSLYGKFEKYSYPIADKVGNVFYEHDAARDYVSYIKGIAGGNFPGIRVAFDCSNGSASGTAPEIFENAGMLRRIIFDRPDGLNINKKCGSTDLSNLSKYVVENKLDLGIAFDGDADRCMAIDENGEVVDGDVIMAICARHMKKMGILKKNTVVGTVMTNMGFVDFCKKEEINFVTAGVGDRYVLEEMLKNGYNLGGEQSGHVIFLNHSTTGDGQLTAVIFLNILIENKIKLSEAKKIISKYPQSILNLDISNVRKRLSDCNDLVRELAEIANKNLGDSGRVIVRSSGTEPLIRIMVECLDESSLKNMVEDISHKARKLLGI
jgi:phosphoglucosamine mutase